MAVISHTHLDHTGGAHEFDRVAVHALEPDAMASPPAASLHPRTEMELLGLAIPVADRLPDSLLEALPEPGFDPTAFTIRPATVTRALADGDVIDLGDRRLRVVRSPGHSPGSIVLLDEDLRWLYTGDVFTTGRSSTRCTARTSRRTSRRCGGCSSSRWLWSAPGHDQSFDGGHLGEIVEAYLELRASY